MTVQAVAVAVVFVAAYVLIATERIHRTAAALTGAAAMVLLGVVDAHGAFHSEQTGIDWNVIFLLLGMMIIVSVVRQTGLFEFVAIWSAKRAKGRPFAVMVQFIVVTAVASALLDNVTTVLLVAPVTMLVCDRLGTSPVPFLIAEAFAANIGGTGTLIGDPPNIIIGSRAGLDFNAFLAHLGPIAALLVGVLIGLCWLFWGRRLSTDEAAAASILGLDEWEAISDRRLLVRCLGVLAGVLAGFALHSAIGVAPSLIALLGAGALVALSGLPTQTYLEDVEWGTLVFFMGLFVMVGALVEVGIIDAIGRAITDAVGGRLFLAGSVLLIASGVLSAIVDNIPYVATMTPIVAHLAQETGDSLWWALALGADLGGNATAVGASANVVILGIAARNNHRISFWEFTRYGLVVTAVTLLVAWAYWVLRYVVAAG